jgi:Fur family peroxide stress response transcriptional regulator
MTLLALVCREQGVPLTVQRRAVFEVILGRDDHPTADQICDQVRRSQPNISRTTVYRILDTFVRVGLVTRICHPGSAARFDPKTHQHHHLVCLQCEKIVDLEDERLNGIAWPDVRRHAFRIEDYHIHFRGICSDCRAERPAPARRKVRK